MGRSPCCSKEGLNRGAWTALEDKILAAYIKAHGEGKWRNLPRRAGLRRCGKSCRLRWLNYLRPDIKRGNISRDEEELIIRLHNLLGNRWSLIAGRLPGRTDNEIKNYWNTTLAKKAAAHSSSPPHAERSRPKTTGVKRLTTEQSTTREPPNSTQAAEPAPQVIRTKASRCSKGLISALSSTNENHSFNSTAIEPVELRTAQSQMANLLQDSENLDVHHGTEELHETCAEVSDFFNFCYNEFQANHDGANENYDLNKNSSMVRDHSVPLDEPILNDWTANFFLEDNANMDLDSMSFLLDSKEWQ